MKKDNRGFLLAESLVVSTFVLTVLILLYIQFSNLTTNYRNSYNYNNVESIYDLSSVVSYLQKNNYDLSSQLTPSKPYVVVFQNNSCNIDAGLADPFCDNIVNTMDAKTIIYTSSDISVIQDYVSNNNDENINQNFRDFISRVETNTVLNKGRLFAEFNNGTYATIAMDNQLNNGEPGPGGNHTIGGQPVEIVDSGDGLYEDSYEDDRLVYRGQSPNNYITFNNEMWRIISKEADGTYKIIRNETIGNIAFDTSNSNDWTKPATLNTYLNGEYLNSINTDSAQIINHDFNIGSITKDNNDLTTQISDEKKKTWNGKVGLISISEYLRAGTNEEKCGTFNLYNSNETECFKTNWMHNIIPAGYTMWSMTPEAGTQLFSIISSGGINTNFGTSIDLICASPVLYLTQDITLSGTGTQSDPYKIQ